MALALIAQHWNDFGFADRLSLSLRAEGRASCLRKAQFHSPASSPGSGRSLLFASTPTAISPRGTMRNKHSYRHKISLFHKISLSCFHASAMDRSRTGEMKHGALGQGSSFFPIFCTHIPSIPAEGHRAAHPGGVSARAPTPHPCTSHSPEPPAAPFPLLPGGLSPSQGCSSEQTPAGSPCFGAAPGGSPRGCAETPVLAAPR